MDVQVLFRVPAAARGIADILGEHGVVEGMGGCTDPDEIADHLDGRAGEWAEAGLDTDDPIGAAWSIASALGEARSPYWVALDAFVEPNRGLRVLGRVIVNPTGEPGDGSDAEVPWTHGKPSMDERTLVAAGLARERADAICAAFFAAPPPGYGR